MIASIESSRSSNALVSSRLPLMVVTVRAGCDRVAMGSGLNMRDVVSALCGQIARGVAAAAMGEPFHPYGRYRYHPTR